MTATPRQAWKRALQTLIRHPWLALIPLAWNALQVLLAWAGIPLGAVPDVGRLADSRFRAILATAPEAGSGGFTLRAFLPSWLPSIADLQIPVQPESLAVPVGLSHTVALTALLVVPLLEAVAQATFLALVAQAVSRSVCNWRRILQAVPGLYIIGMLWHMAHMFLAADGLMVVSLIWLPFYPLLPLVLAAGDRPLGAALLEAPGELWGRLGAWFGMGWRAGLVTLIFNMVWTALGRSTFLAMLFYPFLATWVVFAAVVTYLNHAEKADDEPAPSPTSVWWAPAIVAAILLASGGAYLSSQWSGYRVTREAAMGGLFPVFIARVQAEGDTELILYRNSNRTGLAELAHTRFGWKLLWREEHVHAPRWADGKLSAPAAVYWMKPYSSHGRFLVWGELFDGRVAAVEIAGTTYPLLPEDPYFIIAVPEGPTYEQAPLQLLRLLDENGDPLPLGEGVRP